MIIWKNNCSCIAGTTLRNPSSLEQNNLALHVGGNLHDVIKNREQLSNSLDITLDQWVFLQQTHSNHIYEATKKDLGKGTLDYKDGIADCDSIYTKEKNLAIGVFTADCVPILLYDPCTPLICAIHSGWQGTVKEITTKTMEQLIKQEHIDPKNLLAYIGPAINYESLEVGLEVVEQVKKMNFDTSKFITYKKNGKAFIDNKGLNKQMLLNAGISEENITINPRDTFLQDDELFSYRRDHSCGRHLSFIMLK